MALRLSRRRVSLIAAICIAAVVALGQSAPATAPLYRALSILRSLDAGNFNDVLVWARQGGGQPFLTFTPAQRAESEIAALPQDDRNSVMSWLRGYGRHALYARGVNDADIGPPRPGVDIAAAPTPPPYRNLIFATASLQPEATGGIRVLGGFAAVDHGAKGATVCVSFKNVAAKAASRVVFNFPLVDEPGLVVGTMTLDRKGEFSPNVEIAGYASMQDFLNPVGTHRGFRDNCARIESGVAAIPLLAARFASSHVVRVEYADGPVWNGDDVRRLPEAAPPR